MSAIENRKCPNCEEAMKEIDIIDKTTLPWIDSNLPQQGNLEYVASGVKKSFWTGSLPIEGKVAARMCPSCGRIVLHGEPSMPKVKVLVLLANQDIPAGTVIADFRKWFTSGGIFASGAEPPEAHTFASADEVSALNGQVVRRALAKGDFLRRGDIGLA